MTRRGGPVLAVLAILLPVCGTSEPPSLGREQVVIGVIGSFSGESAPSTAAIFRGAQIAVDDYNRSGESLFEARIEQGDSKGTGEGAAEAARQLATKEFLVGVVGPFTLGESLGAGPILDQAGIPFVIPSVSEVALTEAHFTRLRRIVADDRQEGAALAGDVLRRLDEGSKVGIVHDGDPSGAAFADGARQKLEAGGAQIAGLLEAAGSLDWNAVAAEILKDPPAAVMHGGAGDRAGALIGALRAAGYQGRFAASRQARDAGFGDAAAGAEGSLTDSTCADPEDPAIDGFRETHRNKFSETAAQCSHEAYEATLMILEAIQEVKPTPQEVAAFFRTARSFLGDARRYEYAEDGNLVSPTVWVYELRQGGWRYVRRAGS